MRIAVLDPWLIDVGGHFLDWDLRIAQELISLGHEPRLYSSVRISATARALVPERLQLSPIFRLDCFAHPGSVDPTAGEIILFLDGSAELADDLAQVGDSDLWLWPSLTAAHLHACARFAPNIGISACIHEEPTHIHSNGRMWWRYAFIKAARANLSLNLGTTTGPLAEEYARLSGAMPISRFPVPYDGAACAAPRTELRRIGFFGAQRFEKGAQLLPIIIPRLLQDGYEVVLHDSAGMVQAETTKGLTLLGYIPAIADAISKCELVVIPYDASRYRIRASGVFWECMASGVPAIVPAGTDIGAQVQSTGAGKTFASFSAADVYRSIAEARRDYLELASAAYEQSRRWRDSEGTKRFVAALVGDSGRTGGRQKSRSVTMKVAVVQAYEAPAVPRWIQRCVDSVRNWAGARGYHHHFLREGFFGLSPEWFRARCGSQIGPVTDLSRLYLMRRFFSMDYDAVVWVDADVLVFDPAFLEIRSDTGFVALKEITVGMDQGGAVQVSPITVNGAVIASRRGHALFDFYLYAVESAVRHFTGGEIPRTIAGPDLLTRISQTVPIECLTTVGLFTPAILSDIAAGTDRLPRIFAEHFGHRVAAANLCHFFRDTVTPEQRAYYDAIMESAMDRLIETRGEVVNRFVPTAGSAARA